MNKFDKLFKNILCEQNNYLNKSKDLLVESEDNLISQAVFKNIDFFKHNYAKDVINDIITNKSIKLNEHGTTEFDFSDLSDADIEELKSLLDNPSLNEFNNILKRLSNNTVLWTKIYKGKYSGAVRKNSTKNSNITQLISCLLFFDETGNYEISESFLENLLEIIERYGQHIFLTDADKISALATINSIDLSNTQERLKIKSSIQIYKCISDILEDNNLSIKNVFWCYRNKPLNVSASNPSDIIIEVQTNEDSGKKYIGFSLKSGKAYSKQQKLNSYVLAILKKYIGDESLISEFYRGFNEIVEQFFDDLIITDKDSLNEWLSYKETNKEKLRQIDINTVQFRTIQRFCIDFFINAFKQNKKFKDFFIQKGLGVMSPISKDWDYFIDNGFYVIKGIENGSAASIITPSLENEDDFEVSPDENSIQSFNIKFNNHDYKATIRTSDGGGMLEVPNLKFTIQ